MNPLRLLLSALLLLGTGLAAAQQLVSEAPRPFMKKEEVNSFSILLEGQSKNVQAVLDEKFRAGTGVKGKPVSGLTAYEGARYAQLANNTMDLYYRVERGGKGEENSSRVTLFLSTGNGNFIQSANYPDVVANAIELLEGLQSEVRIYEMGVVIEEQKKAIDREIKLQEKLVKDSVALQNQLAQTLKAIDENRTSRQNQVVKIGEEEQRLRDYDARLAEMKTVQQTETAQRAEAKRQAQTARLQRIQEQQEQPKPQPPPAQPGGGGN